MNSNKKGHLKCSYLFTAIKNESTEDFFKTEF